MTPVEWLLWSRLSEWRSLGYKFRRQHPIAPYIVDFACIGGRLIIEVDGPSHDYSLAADAVRQAYLERLGWRVLRFPAAEVFRDIGAVLDAIFAVISLAPPLPLPAERGGRVGQASSAAPPSPRGSEAPPLPTTMHWTLLK